MKYIPIIFLVALAVICSSCRESKSTRYTPPPTPTTEVTPAPSPTKSLRDYHEEIAEAFRTYDNDDPAGLQAAIDKLNSEYFGGTDDTPVSTPTPTPISTPDLTSSHCDCYSYDLNFRVSCFLVTAICNDGTCSTSIVDNDQCSSHGGVRTLLNMGHEELPYVFIYGNESQ